MFHLSGSEKKSLVVALAAMLLAVGGYYGYEYRREENTAADPLTPEEEQQMKMLRREADEAKREEAEAVKAAGRPFPFDPNEADSATLIRVGLQPQQVRNLMKYRRKGGRWRSAAHFSRLYGLSSEEYLRLKPYLRFREQKAHEERDWVVDDEAGYVPRQYEKAHFDGPKVEKYPEGTRLSLNQADTAELKRIPGIGSFYASKIVRYREQLGGFIRVGQVEEIPGLPVGISRWFTVDAADKPRLRRLNQCTFKELVRHPYLSYEQVKDIFNHIRHYGPVREWSDLRLYPNFTEADVERLKEYFVLE